MFQTLQQRCRVYFLLVTKMPACFLPSRKWVRWEWERAEIVFKHHFVLFRWTHDLFKTFLAGFNRNCVEWTARKSRFFGYFLHEKKQHFQGMFKRFFFVNFFAWIFALFRVPRAWNWAKSIPRYRERKLRSSTSIRWEETSRHKNEHDTKKQDRVQDCCVW